MIAAEILHRLRGSGWRWFVSPREHPCYARVNSGTTA